MNPSRELRFERRVALWLTLIFIAEAFAMMLALYRSIGSPAFTGPDSGSYYGLDMAHLTYRAPLYPALVAVLRSLSGDWHLFALSVVQIAVWAVSIPAFCRVAMATGGCRWGLAVSAVYALLPPFTVWVLGVYTEALSISLCVLAIYFLYRLLYDKAASRLTMTVMLGLMQLLLVMTRPSFIYMPVLTGLFGLFILWRCPASRRAGGGLLVIAVVCGAYLAAYSGLVVYRQTGLLSPSTVSLDNEYFMVRKANVLNPSLTGNPALSRAVDDMLHDMPDMSACDEPAVIWKEAFWLRRNFDAGELHRLVSASAAVGGERYRSYRAGLIRDGWGEPLFCGGVNNGGGGAMELQRKWGRMQAGMHLTLGLGLIFVICYGTALALGGRHVGLRLLLAWLTLMPLAHYAVLAIGAPYDHSRLFLQAVPCVLLLAGSAAHCLTGLIRSGFRTFLH